MDDQANLQLYVHPGDDLPIYRQIVRQVTDAIATGRLGPGDRLPSHRDLAARLVIAPLTVKKAYDELEQNGLIDTQRGRGTFVSVTPPAIDPAESRQRLRETAQRLVTEAALSGISFHEVLKLLDEIQKERQP
jgi:GntR family transcriptional regulator